MELSEKQLGTLILAMQYSFENRESIKETATKTGMKHLNDLDAEFKLLFHLYSELKKIKKQNEP